MSSTVQIIDSPVENCGCCKDILLESDPLFIRLSCKHPYHYDCIYDAFLYNKKRNQTVLECPYCRKTVLPLPEREGYTLLPSIHFGLNGANWNTKYIDGCCNFLKDGKYYCNKSEICDTNNKLCWAHRNIIHKEGKCAFKSGLLYCNNTCVGQYCFKHCKYESLKKCSYQSKSGKQCKSWISLENENCSIHQALKEKEKDIVTCKAILKLGKRKGEICGAKNCKRHVINETNSEVKDIEIIPVVQPVIVNVEKNDIPPEYICEIEKVKYSKLLHFIDNLIMFENEKDKLKTYLEEHFLIKNE